MDSQYSLYSHDRDAIATNYLLLIGLSGVIILLATEVILVGVPTSAQSGKFSTPSKILLNFNIFQEFLKTFRKQ